MTDSHAGLARWTPVRLEFSGPAPVVYWADLSSERFVDPFFDQTIARWAAGPHARPVVRTGLEALDVLDGEPSLEPAGMIFHLSRCGSTLVSRLLGTLPGVVVVSEPSPLNTLLGLGPGQIEDATLVRLVRLVVRALGRRRHGDEQRLVLKCTSWNIRRRAILAAAFPETPWIWVQREPARVLASLLAMPPGWLRLQATPQHAAQRFGLDPVTIPAMTRPEFAASVLAAMLDAAATDPSGRLCVDYSELPDAIWQSAASHFGIEANDAAIERMRFESRFYAKSLIRQPFSGDSPQLRPLTDDMREAARRFVEPGYRALAGDCRLP
ncbi:hypothetical protein MNAB215_1246 [Mycobacterium numidiamassiliense]|uniref:Sulfotransferase family protein n=1 Tax=Mycobacterium numidiamassiliense TaxID=1841861 RepID=A0A2U3P5M7_9MYCO|nr:hypothetical protein [Mycobacterium numidiamassiliense]SPM39064.1 hypothetical protein MNAB215_1246 [Mycobacterium numidiamassiliense]